MRYINSTLKEYKSGLIDKPEYIKRMFEEHHSHLFDYANNLIKTNIKKIEILALEVYSRKLVMIYYLSTIKILFRFILISQQKN